MNMNLVDSIGFYDIFHTFLGGIRWVCVSIKSYRRKKHRIFVQEMDTVQTLRRGVLIDDASDPNGFLWEKWDEVILLSLFEQNHF